MPTFNEITDKMVDIMKEDADGTTIVPLKKYITSHTLNVVSNVS